MRARCSGPVLSALSQKRVAMIHDYLVVPRGGERVFSVLVDACPWADVYCLVTSHNMRDFLSRPARSTFLSNLPFPESLYRHYGPLYPLALRQLGVLSYDVVISSSSSFVHHAQTTGIHVCYMHSPLRYAWAERDAVAGRLPVVLRPAWRGISETFRSWDRAGAQRVHTFIANSTSTARQIGTSYERCAPVVYPPVIPESVLSCAEQERDDFYLSVLSLQAYKRPDVLLDAFRLRLDARLVLVGDGPLLGWVRRNASSNVTVMGRVSDAELEALYRTCRAVIIPGPEDFGLVAVEAQGRGASVIACAMAGAAETVVEGVTGVTFAMPDAHLLVDALRRHRALRIDHKTIRENAARFTLGEFVQRFDQVLLGVLK